MSTLGLELRFVARYLASLEYSSGMRWARVLSLLVISWFSETTFTCIL